MTDLIQEITETYDAYDKAMNEASSDIRLVVGGHLCGSDLPSGLYGRAIAYCYEDQSGRFWSGNYEYASQVNHCPYCGAVAPITAPPAS